ncbi:MAG TPA: hypothetical protein VHR88_07760 [Solirubrobacteraceae bacterium]|nr:hypothetical protein [Solirubrobacteraceae bacterium]
MTVGLAFATPASATSTEIGHQDNPPAASCPGSPCLAVSRTTGFQAKIGDTRNPMVSSVNGRLVAFTLQLAKPDDNQINFFNSNLGGAPQARISVLRLQSDKKTYKLTGQSELWDLTPYLGMTAQFPLARTIIVRQGDLIALTVPTWAPTLAVGQDRKDGWRADRSATACDDTKAQAALQSLKGAAPFPCLYRTARLTYTATVISTP